MSHCCVSILGLQWIIALKQSFRKCFLITQQNRFWGQTIPFKAATSKSWIFICSILQFSAYLFGSTGGLDLYQSWCYVGRSKSGFHLWETSFRFLLLGNESSEYNFTVGSEILFVIARLATGMRSGWNCLVWRHSIQIKTIKWSEFGETALGGKLSEFGETSGLSLEWQH